jgi:hypothetical protein
MRFACDCVHLAYSDAHECCDVRSWMNRGGIFGSHTDAQLGVTALICSARHGRADCARLLLDAGADKNATINVRGRIAAFAVRMGRSVFWVFFGTMMMMVAISNFTFWYYCIC